MSRAATLVAAVALVFLSTFLVRDHTRDDSLSADEPVHILSAWHEVAGRNAIVNIEHPPLAKMLVGLALQTLPLPPPPETVPMGALFPDFVHAFLFGNRVSPDAIAAVARAPFLSVLALLLTLVFVSATTRYGMAAGLFAVALVALEPNFVAHAGVVHTDVPAAVAFLAAVLAWERAERRPTPLRLLVAAVVLGLALATKFSTVLLLPILLVQSLIAARRDPRPWRAAARASVRLALVAFAALLVVLSVYVPVMSRMNPHDQRGVIHEMVAARGAPRVSAAIEPLVAVSQPLAHYAGGLASVLRTGAVGQELNYLGGKTSFRGFPSYFFVAFALKSTLAFLAVTLLAAVFFFRRPSQFREEGRLFLLPVAVLFLASIGSAYNIGIRHMLPVYPFLALAGAAVFARLSERPAVQRQRPAPAAVVLALLPLLSAYELLRIHPHELSYFNPLSGGPERGRFILSDSNVDWGLDLKRLAAELSRRRVTDPTIVYFGGDDVPMRVGVPNFVVEPRVRGALVAISAYFLTVGPGLAEYHSDHPAAAPLRNLLTEITTRGRPAGHVGYSIYLFELSPRDTRQGGRNTG
jgi:4-amino-4-deoxy-L-arabinose transferase-like glycosyltransferase